MGLLSGACAQGSRPHPPTSREPTPVRGVALVLGGQNPITLEYEIYPPPIDTLVTGMTLATFLSAKREKPSKHGCTNKGLEFYGAGELCEKIEFESCV